MRRNGRGRQVKSVARQRAVLRKLSELNSGTWYLSWLLRLWKAYHGTLTL